VPLHLLSRVRSEGAALTTRQVTPHLVKTCGSNPPGRVLPRRRRRAASSAADSQTLYQQRPWRQRNGVIHDRSAPPSRVQQRDRHREIHKIQRRRVLRVHSIAAAFTRSLRLVVARQPRSLAGEVQLLGASPILPAARTGAKGAALIAHDAAPHPINPRA
jgi:hypothetical protein